MIAFNFYVFPERQLRVNLRFSERQHFHTEDITVEITPTVHGVQIFYSLDGSVPTLESYEYTEPLHFAVLDDMQVITLRAVAVFEEKVVSDPFTHTYFVGRDVHERFDTMIFSLTTNPEYLFGHDEGILVAGKIRSDFISENPEREISPLDPANFNEGGPEWERPVYIETFIPGGRRVLAQAAGVRTHGGWDINTEQHALRLIARREYSPDTGRFAFRHLDDTTLDGFNVPLTSYNTLILRNGGNDRYHGMLRNETALSLSKLAGVNVVSSARPAAVFINGEYYGFAWLQARNTDHYLEDVFAAPSREFDNISGGESEFDTDDIELLMDLYELVAFAEKDLTDDAVFAELEDILDIDDFLRYYAFQMYIGADDWPHDNLRRWRYTGEQVTGIAPELDGRWRHIANNMDWILGLNGEDFRKPTFENILAGNNPRSPMLVSILERDDMLERFLIIVNDIAANAVTAQNMRGVIDTLLADAGNEMRYSIEAGKYPRGFTWSVAMQNHLRMVEFARLRPRAVFPFLAEHFEFENRLFTVTVTEGEAVIGSLPAVSSQYFEHLTVPVSPVLPQFTAFDHWVLNGRQINVRDITVSAADAVNGTVELQLVTRPDYPVLMIHDAYVRSRDNRNFVVLRSPIDEETYTDGLFLSNTLDNLQRMRVPVQNLPAPGSIEIVEDTETEDEQELEHSGLLRVRVNFNIRTGRPVYLSDTTGRILHTFVPMP
jgi:hypothetical protein